MTSGPPSGRGPGARCSPRPAAGTGAALAPGSPPEAAADRRQVLSLLQPLYQLERLEARLHRGGPLYPGLAEFLAEGVRFEFRRALLPEDAGFYLRYREPLTDLDRQLGIRRDEYITAVGVPFKRRASRPRRVTAADRGTGDPSR